MWMTFNLHAWWTWVTLMKQGSLGNRSKCYVVFLPWFPLYTFLGLLLALDQKPDIYISWLFVKCNIESLSLFILKRNVFFIDIWYKCVNIIIPLESLGFMDKKTKRKIRFMWTFSVREKLVILMLLFYLFLFLNSELKRDWGMQTLKLGRNQINWFCQF